MTPFQSTHSRGVRLLRIRPQDLVARFQSTHSRGVRPPDRRVAPLLRDVSIHALARSATIWPASTDNWIGTFQSTHSRGVRPSSCAPRPALPRSFNPRTREECDFCFAVLGDSKMVSIHELARSATSTSSSAPIASSGFNPRTREECDEWSQSSAHYDRHVSIHALARSATLMPRRHPLAAHQFQSTHSRGVRPRSPRRFWRHCGSFNPRTREECDTAACTR